MTSVVIKRGILRQRRAHRRIRVKMKTGGAMFPQAKEHGRPLTNQQESRESWNRFSQPRQNHPCLNLDLGLAASRTWADTALPSRPPVCGSLLLQPKKPTWRPSSRPGPLETPRPAPGLRGRTQIPDGGGEWEKLRQEDLPSSLLASGSS